MVKIILSLLLLQGCIKVDVYNHEKNTTPIVEPTQLPNISGPIFEPLIDHAGPGKVKAGSGFSTKGWNSNNYGKIEYDLGSSYKKGYMQIEAKGFTLPLNANKFCDKKDGKYHIFAGAKSLGNKAMSAFRLRITSGTNEMKLILSGSQSNGWGSNVDDCQFKGLIKDPSIYNKYKFVWDDTNFKFYFNDELKCERTVSPGFLIRYFYIGHDMNRQEKYCDDIYIKNLEIGE